jgi:hypothetical protein
MYKSVCMYVYGIVSIYVYIYMYVYECMEVSVSKFVSWAVCFEFLIDSKTTLL